MLEKVKDSVKKYRMLSRGDIVLIAVSGGPDSVAMLHSLKNLIEEYDLGIHIYHLNHNFRGQESDQDAYFVKKLGKEHKIPVTIDEYDVAGYIRKHGLSVQEGARKIRYELMERKAQEIGANKIAVGQNANDQAETILMRFLRGTGPHGLAGIAPVRGQRYIRPLIEVWRKEIEEFLKQEQIEVRLDKSNLKPVYLRNKIRLSLLPQLREEYNSNIDQALVNMGGIFREEESYLEDMTGKALQKHTVEQSDREIVIEKEGFLKEPKALQRRIIKLLWDEVTDNGSSLNYIHIEKALKLIAQGSVGSKMNLPQGIEIKNSYGVFATGNLQQQKIVSFNHLIKVPDKIQIQGITIETKILKADNRENFNFQKVNPDVAREVFLDYDLITEDLYFRNRLPGDVFSPFKGRGRKKLKKYFIDLKIPREERDEVLLLAMNNCVLWVAGRSINERYKVTAASKNILHISLTKN